MKIRYDMIWYDMIWYDMKQTHNGQQSYCHGVGGWLVASFPGLLMSLGTRLSWLLDMVNFSPLTTYARVNEMGINARERRADSTPATDGTPGVQTKTQSYKCITTDNLQQAVHHSMSFRKVALCMAQISCTDVHVANHWCKHTLRCVNK